VHKGEASLLSRRLGQCAQKEDRLETGVAMNVAIIIMGKDKATNQGGRPVAPSAGTPQGEAKIFLAIAAQEVFTSGLVDRRRHCGATDGLAHCVSHSR
jgi:hypothetical protein